MGSSNLYFAATCDEFQKAAPGWLFPADNVEAPRELTARNPFTGAEMRAWDYQNAVQPDPPPTSSFPDLSGFAQMSSRLLDPFELGELVHAIDGSDASKLAGQIAGQLLISSGEHEVFIMLIPSTICIAVAQLDPSALDVVAERWMQPQTDSRRAGFFAKLLGFLTKPFSRNRAQVVTSVQVPLERRRAALGEFHRLARSAVDNGRQVFLQQSP